MNQFIEEQAYAEILASVASLPNLIIKSKETLLKSKNHNFVFINASVCLNDLRVLRKSSIRNVLKIYGKPSTLLLSNGIASSFGYRADPFATKPP